MGKQGSSNSGTSKKGEPKKKKKIKRGRKSFQVGLDLFSPPSMCHILCAPLAAPSRRKHLLFLPGFRGQRKVFSHPLFFREGFRNREIGGNVGAFGKEIKKKKNKIVCCRKDAMEMERFLGQDGVENEMREFVLQV